MIRRRLYAEIRTSKLAVWSFRLAIFVLPVLLLAVLLHRAGAIEYHAALVLLIAVLLLAALALALATGALIVIWNEGLKGLGSAMLAAAISAIVLAYPVFEILRGITLPAISDVSTDTADPPRFHSIAVLRPRSANPVGYPGMEAAELQRRYYPAVRSLEFDAEAEEVFGAALTLVQRNGWLLADNIPPAANRDGRIEAIAATPLMGFREDVSIRVRKVGNIVRVDVRSASRYGSRDFGTNARRIESFLAQLTDARRRPR
ncbi:MAG: DUF1499 domain-containing protein [Xanthobacteraceae bacterium]|nr:DUF1499 domain-containing protein [Xanthobacteraceae bacterium]